MRSSKSRSRSKSNRNRSIGNVVNRVFESSGPEGKVRGTPQQIIDKYNQLARDAQLANDRVAAENFQQHAEHYLRLLAEAQREQQERQQQQQQQQQQHAQQNATRRQNEDRKDATEPDEAQRPGTAEARGDDVIDLGAEDGASGLVETPEERPKRRRGGRRPKAEAGATEQASAGEANGPGDMPQAAPDAAE